MERDVHILLDYSITVVRQKEPHMKLRVGGSAVYRRRTQTDTLCCSTLDRYSFLALYGSVNRPSLADSVRH